MGAAVSGVQANDRDGTMTTKQNTQSIGQRLKLLRGERTQKEFALEFGISTPSVQKYELGEAIPGGPALAKLARKSVNIHWVLTGEGEALLPLLSGDRQSQEIAKEVYLRMITSLLPSLDSKSLRDLLDHVKKEKILTDYRKTTKEPQ